MNWKRSNSSFESHQHPQNHKYYFIYLNIVSNAVVVFVLCFSWSFLFGSWGTLWFTNHCGIRDVFWRVYLWISSYQSAMMAYMPVPCALDIIYDYLPSKPETQKVQGSFLKGWPLPATLLGNKPLSAVCQSTECRFSDCCPRTRQTYDVDQVSNVRMKNRSLYAKYPRGTYNMIAAIYF